MKKIIIIFLLLMIIPFISGEESGGTLIGKQDSCITLPQECSSCSFVNITSIQYPNMTREYINAVMNKSGTSYGYSFCKTDTSGDYNYCFLGDIDGTNTAACNSFIITPTGDLLTSGKSILMFLYLVGAVLIFIFILIGAVKIPFRNKRNGEEGVIGINDLKYVKIILICLSYVTFLFIIATLRGITNYYITSIGISNFFDWIYWILMSALWPLIVCSLILMFIALINDKKLQKDLERGINY